MSRTVYYDANGNEIYEDAPTYAQEQLADIERRRAVSDGYTIRLEDVIKEIENMRDIVCKEVDKTGGLCNDCPLCSSKHGCGFDYINRRLEYDRKHWKAWCLKQKYEGEHKVKQTGLSFGQAIEAIKAGKRCSRVGWNGKNQYIELATNISYKDAHGDIINANHDAIGNRAIAFVGTSGVQLGWLASQSDMIAEDWQIVD